MKVFIISILVTLYHFIYRIIVGETISKIDSDKKIDFNSFLLHEFKFEKNLYEILKVKEWKNSMITAKPYKFDFYNRTSMEILRSMLIAEKVHIICFFLSYLPLLLIIPFGNPIIFIITSFLASLIDLAYVIIQRYNIPRVVKIIRNSV
jgi:hypothetical protein